MKRTRSLKKYVESSGSESDNQPLKKSPVTKSKTQAEGESSSSESDIESYLHKPEKLDLNSEFFNTQNDKIEAKASSKLSDSDSDIEAPASSCSSQQPEVLTQFNSFQNYTRQIEEARKHVELYEAKKHKTETQTDILHLLSAGESRLAEHNLTPADLHSSDFESCESEREDWEEIKNSSEVVKEKNLIPAKDLQIVVNMPENVKKKKGVDLLAAMKRRLNRIRKENQVLVHKVHLLCWLAHGNYLNSIINRTDILATALSLMPSEQSFPSDRTDLKYLEQIVTWFKKTVTMIENHKGKKSLPLDESLLDQMQKKKAIDAKMTVLIFVALLRSFGVQARLVLSLQVEPMRPPASDLHYVGNKDNPPKKDKKQSVPTVTVQKATPVKKKSRVKPDVESAKKVIKAKTETLTVITKNKSTRSKSSENAISKTKIVQEAGDMVYDKPKRRARSTGNSNTSEDKPKPPRTVTKSDSKQPNAKKTAPTRRSTRQSCSKISQLDGLLDSSDNSESEILQLDGVTESDTKPNLKNLKIAKDVPQKLKQKRPNLKVLKRQTNPQYSDSDSEFEPSGSISFQKKLNQAAADLNNLKETKLRKRKPHDVKDVVVELVKDRVSKQKMSDRSRLANKRKPPDESEDSDYVPEPIKKKHQDSEDDFLLKTKVKRRVQVKPELQDNGARKKKPGQDVWVEVFLESEEKWISVDVVSGQVHCVKEISQRATHPICYVVTWDNNSNLKDVTQRYCPNFNTVTRKLRVDGKWWAESLRPFRGLSTLRDKEEDEDLARQQMDQPLPKSIAEFKDHPLYALKRHLLKFEAIYPPEPPTLGFIRGEAVYPRGCVFTLHSRDIWLKQAKVVKLGEQPYKIVKARPKWDKLSNQVITDQLLEIFGPWQVEDYIPPTAQNGQVPRNAFGNVDLFKPCMLPKGCVHLKLPGLNKVAKKLNIDCAAAIIGFDFHSGWSHPIYDGFVVCKEFEEQLVSAWETEQDELERKEQEKIDKRVYGNWKKLIRGLLIRERLKAKYDFGQPSSSAVGKKSQNGSRKK